MLGPIFVYLLLVVVCATAIARPAWGLIGFYGFLLLDPAWNWRWSLAPGVEYQKYIFCALFAGFALQAFRGQRQSGISRVGIFACVSFFCLCLLSASQSISPIDSEFFMGIIWKQLLVVVLGLFVLNSPARIKALLVVAVLAQGYNSYQINLDYFQTGFSRYAYSSWGSMGVDNNGYSIVTVPILGMAFALALFESKIWTRALFFGIGMLQVHQIMLMESRGCMLAAVFMIGILVWKMPLRYGNIKTITVAFLLGALLAGPPVVKEFTSSFNSEENRDSSAESRIYLWKAGARISMDYPLMGVGPNAARILVPQPEYYDGGLEVANKALHNLYFDVSTGVGIPGFICYFAFILSPVFYAWRTYHRDDNETGAIRLAVVGGVVGYLAASVFSSGLLFESCYILVIAGYCISNIDSVSPLEELDAEFATDIDGRYDGLPSSEI